MKNYSQLQYEASQLRLAKVVSAIESIAIMIFALFTSAFLPQILLKYMYAGQQLTQEPALLTYIPIVAFALGATYFVAAVLANILRSQKIMALESEMKKVSVVADNCCNNCSDSCTCDEHGNCECGSCETEPEKIFTSEKRRVIKKK